MNESSDFLKKLDRRSKEKQDAFLQHIADRLGRPRLKEPPQHPLKGAPDFWKKYRLEPGECIELFMENWKEVGGEAERLPDMDAAKKFILKTVHKMEAKHLLLHDDADLTGMNLNEAVADVTVWDAKLKDTMKAKAAGADIGLIVADYAVAHTGSVITMSGAKKGRIVSLFPTALMVIVPANRVKIRLGEVMREIRTAGEAGMPAGIHFISGPSRSADIENDLTIGVHGPGVVYALVVG